MLISGVASSYVYLLEGRSHSLLQNKFRIQSTKRRIIYHFLIFLSNGISLTLFLINVPSNQKTAKREALTMYPCPTEEFFIFPIYILISNTNNLHLVIYVYIPFFALNTLAHFLFHIWCTVYYLYIAPPKSVSMATQLYQRNFLVGTLLQIFTLFSFMTLPVILVAVSLYLNRYSQELMNVAVDCIALHGIVECIVILSVHKHYRNAMKLMINRWYNQRKNFFQNEISKQFKLSSTATFFSV